MQPIQDYMTTDSHSAAGVIPVITQNKTTTNTAYLPDSAQLP